jgi:hypothetical protein
MLVLSLTLGLQLALADSTPTKRWYGLAVDGVRTGYAYDEHIATPNGSTVREAIVIEVRQLGHRSRIETLVELQRNAADQPIAFEYKSSAGPVHNAWRGTIESGRMHIQPLAWHSGNESTVPLTPDVALTPDRAEQFGSLLKEQQSALTFQAFDPASQSSVSTKAERVGHDDLHQVRVTRGRTSEDIWFEPSGAIARIESRAFGGKLTWTPCASDCDAPIEQPIDPMDHLIVRSPVQIFVSAKKRTLRYVIARTDDARPLLALTAEQNVVFDGDRAVVTICNTCGDEESANATDVQRYLAPNAWVRSDDAEIHRLALATVPRGASVDFRMRKLTTTVMQRMHGSNDFLGYADAVTALHTGSGDCTEFAVLLAALARAQGIPARVVVGLAYSSRFSGREHVFSPHMWVQAYDGKKWKSYDAALDGFDSTHIAFAVGNGEPQEVDTAFAQLPVLRIEKAAAVREN